VTWPIVRHVRVSMIVTPLLAARPVPTLRDTYARWSALSNATATGVEPPTPACRDAASSLLATSCVEAAFCTSATSDVMPAE
jgi:hypothetical protein